MQRGVSAAEEEEGRDGERWKKLRREKSGGKRGKNRI